MRENIGLYRGKRIDNGEWVVARSFLCMEDTSPVCWLSSQSISDCTADKNGNLIGVRAIEGAYHIFCKVAPETVGQYTGLTDKNGEKIFEGDIVRFGWDTAGERCHIVEFVDGEFCVTPVISSEDTWSFRICGENKKITVIGNIHDNPELLTQKNI